MCIFGSDAVMQDNSKVCIGYAVGVYNLMPGFVINKQAYFIGVEKRLLRISFTFMIESTLFRVAGA